MFFQTQRLSVRPFQAEDTEDLYAVLSDAAVMQYLELPFSRAQVEVFLQKCALCPAPLIWAVVLRESGRVIGHLIFHPYDSAQEFELGWVLGSAHWKQGYATELTCGAIAEARRMGLRALVLECAPAQRVTAQIAARFGFQSAGEADGCAVFRLELS